MMTAMAAAAARQCSSRSFTFSFRMLRAGLGASIRPPLLTARMNLWDSHPRAPRLSTDHRQSSTIVTMLVEVRMIGRDNAWWYGKGGLEKK
ncbi:hypothetical protein N9L68_06350 [bacterium]|nr:hypothetical protein [bacterium]